METSNEIILYQPDSTVRLEVRLEDETVWLTQQQIADLFGVKQPAISKHLKNIFESGELLESSVHSILEYTATDGKSYKTKFYNLDAILSVGYRVNSKNSQYAPVTLKTYKAAHDRFLIIDHVVYHVGASFKDLGKKLFAFSKMEVMSADGLIAHLETAE
ncbi:MAG: DNA-binding protein [Odoribacter sp.]|nr:DNA-binding protein [Odoribacter sp.]